MICKNSEPKPQIFPQRRERLQLFPMQIAISRLKWWGELEIISSIEMFDFYAPQWSHPFACSYVFQIVAILEKSTERICFSFRVAVICLWLPGTVCFSRQHPTVKPVKISVPSRPKPTHLLFFVDPYFKKTETPKDRRLRNVHSESPVLWKDTPNFCKDCGLGS